MAKVFIEETTLTAIGDAIRGKTGKTELLDPANMSAEIEAIEAGGGDSELINKFCNLTGDCSYMFFGPSWSWVVEDYGDQITTQNITSISYMFESSTLKEIPFTLNMKPYSEINLTQAFARAQSLTSCPKIRFDLTELAANTRINMYAFLEYVSKLTNIDDLFDPEQIKVIVNAIFEINADNCLHSLQRLKTLPPWFYALCTSPDHKSFPQEWQTPYWGFSGLQCLDEATNLPVWRSTREGVGWSGSAFEATGQGFGRIKNFTFETDNGTPYVAPWANQYINLADYYYGTGFMPSADGLSAARNVYGEDKEVKDDATYQALKNDPDWYTSSWKWSRYNHDSAVATINSLPDTSAWAEANGINTIKFRGAAGEKTDGGAINTLTEEEIAVATAKGWTVSLV